MLILSNLSEAIQLCTVIPIRTIQLIIIHILKQKLDT